MAQNIRTHYSDSVTLKGKLLTVIRDVFEKSEACSCPVTR
jgi:hypothetical protein